MVGRVRAAFSTTDYRPLLQDPSPDHHISVVEDARLPRRDRANGTVEETASRSVLSRNDRCGDLGCAMATPRRRAKRTGRPPGGVSQVADLRFFGFELFAATDDHAIRVGIDRNDVEPLRGRDPQPASLTDGETVMTFVSADRLAPDVLDRTRPSGLRQTQRPRLHRDEVAGACARGGGAGLLAL